MSRHEFFGKLLLFTFLGILTTTSTLSAQCCGGNGNETRYYGRPTTNWNTYTYEYYGTPCDPSPSTKSCGLCGPWGNSCGTYTGFYFGLEGLYWTVCQDNIDYAVEFDSDDDDAILGPGDTKFLDYDWCGGGRAHFGYKRCGWDIRGNYTWYKNMSDDRTDRQGSDTLLKASLLHPDTTGEDAERATVDSEIKYQNFDILFGRDLCFCEGSILLQPFFGVRWIQLEQDLEALYEGEDFVLLPSQPFIGGDDAIPARVRWHSKLSAVGLNAGLNMYYKWYCGFGLYGAFNGSVLASKTDVKHKQETLDSEGNVDSTQIDIKEEECVCVPGYQIGSGITWDSCCGDCFYFMFKLGYEFNHWFNTPQIRRYHNGNEGVSSDSKGNIGFHGLTASANFYF